MLSLNHCMLFALICLYCKQLQQILNQNWLAIMLRCAELTVTLCHVKLDQVLDKTSCFIYKLLLNAANSGQTSNLICSFFLNWYFTKHTDITQDCKRDKPAASCAERCSASASCWSSDGWFGSIVRLSRACSGTSPSPKKGVSRPVVPITSTLRFKSIQHWQTEQVSVMFVAAMDISLEI